MKAFYVSSDRGGSIITDDLGIVMKFQNQNTNLAKDNVGNLFRTNEPSLWFCTLDDEGLIKRAEAHPLFNKEYRRVDKFPESKKVSMVKSMEARSEISEEIRKETKEELNKKYKKFISLQGKLYKKDGMPRADASEEELNEFKELKNELEY